MDGFKQIRSFYSWVFNNPDKARQSHISLYVFLINQNNRNMWVEWFKCPRDLAMAGACIGSNNTYYKVLDDLKNWDLLEYKKGINDFKAPMIKLNCLYKSEQLTAQVSAPLSAPLTAPLPAQLSVQLTAPIYKRITDNFKLINNNENDFINLLDNFIKDKTENNLNNSIDFKLLLNFFNETYGRKLNVISDKTKKQIKERLKEGYSKEDLKQALLNAKNDPYHIENNFKYITLEFISRSDKFERYSQIHQTNVKPRMI